MTPATPSPTGTAAPTTRGRINLGRVRILYNEDHPGSGKSTDLRRRMAMQPGRYLYMVPSVDLVGEATRSIADISAQAGMLAPACVEIHSQVNLKGQTVPRALMAEAAKHPHGSHVVVVCTHEGAFGLPDFSAFAGWRLYVDEVPDAVDGGVLSTGTAISATILASLYDLQEMENGWSRLTPKPNGPSTRSVESDDLLQALGTLHRRAATWLTFVDVVDWNEVARRRSWSWFSIWDLERLAVFSEVRIIGNSLMASLPIQIALSLDEQTKDVVFKPFRLSRSTSARVARTVHIHYFTDHAATARFWRTPEGQRCINAVAAWLKKHAGPDLMWSANEEVASIMATAGLPGLKVQPLLAGLNRHRHRTWAALIYSAKMQPHEREALRVFEPNGVGVRVSREIEALVQFVFRTALRDDASSATINYAVYDRFQAEKVAEYISVRDLGDVRLHHHDVGIGDIVPATVSPNRSGKTRPPSSGKPAMTDAERQRAKRARDRAKRQGTAT